MATTFRASFCDPVQPDIIELGELSAANIMDHFEKIDWDQYLQSIATAKQEDIYYSPSFEVENKENKNGLVVSAIGKPDNYDFHIFYKRPKMVKSFFGLQTSINDNYLTDLEGQTKADALDCINALLRNDMDFLANKIGL